MPVPLKNLKISETRFMRHKKLQHEQKKQKRKQLQRFKIRTKSTEPQSAQLKQKKDRANTCNYKNFT